MYPAELTQPMAAELTNNGFVGLTTAEEVTNTIENTEGTVFVVINSVCGCAAANARPAALMAIKNAKKPNVCATVFAGVDKDAVDKTRSYTLPYPPSSPSMALFKNGQLVHFVERHHIEGRPAEMIAQNLIAAFDQYC